MRYAILSDIHGNFDALQAILSDCTTQAIDRYLFLGDYYGEFPMQNEVFACVMHVQNAYAIKGNREERFLHFLKTKEKTWTSEQFTPIYWNIRHTDAEYRKFIERLPEKVSFLCEKMSFHMAHAPSQHFGAGIVDSIGGRMYLSLFGKEFRNHKEYLLYIDNRLHADPAFQRKLSLLPDGVYLFGHYHTQWHARVNGKILINPGSCGLPLDFETSAPYTILDTGNDVTITERRVEYDREKTLQHLIHSAFYDAAPFWNSLSCREFECAQMTAMLFIEFVEKLAKERNDSVRPYANALWREAISLYTQTNLPWTD